MCARFEINHVPIRRGMRIPVLRGRKAVSAKWAGMAQSERLDWWKRKGAVLVEVPAGRFAEYSPVRDDLIWEELPPGDALVGIIVQDGDSFTLRIVTRDSTVEEMLHFQTLRMPLVVHDDEGVPPVDLPAIQQELL